MVKTSIYNKHDFVLLLIKDHNDRELGGGYLGVVVGSLGVCWV